MEDLMHMALTREQLERRRAAADEADEGTLLRPRAHLSLHVLASGSKGNCSVVENIATGECLIVDCGISKRAFMERCGACGVDPARIVGILITHEHTDHTKGLGVVTRGLAKMGVTPVLYASRAVHGASRNICQVQDTLDLRHFSRGDDLQLAGIDVHAFATSHDAAESFGFRFETRGDSLGFMTDTGIVTGEASEALQRCKVLALEANHDPKMLKYGPYPQMLKDRIASERGHLSNVQSAQLLEQLLCNELECVIGMHVSENNNTYDLPGIALGQTLLTSDHSARVLVGRQNTPVSI